MGKSNILLVEDKSLLPFESASEIDACDFRDISDLMTYPFFSLSKGIRREPIVYEKDDIYVSVTGSKYGIATIWDADFLIWLISKINKDIEDSPSDRLPDRHISFKLFDYLSDTGKTVSGNFYREFEGALKRLNTTNVRTSIRALTGNAVMAFNWLDNYYYKYNNGENSAHAEIWLNQWVFDAAIRHKMVLQIPREYFTLKSGLQKWLYKVCRRHCGKQKRWGCYIKTLYQKSGSADSLKHFRYKMKTEIAGDLLNYYISFDSKTDKVLVTS